MMARFTILKTVLVLGSLCALVAACGKGEGGGGGGADGPESIQVPEIAVSTAAADIAKGEATFKTKGCVACHKVGGGKLVGPDLKGVTARRSIKWMERMILHPEIMIKEDATAKELLKTHFTPMANQNVNPSEELPFILAYLKSHES